MLHLPDETDVDDDEYMNAAAAHAAFLMTISAAANITLTILTLLNQLNPTNSNHSSKTIIYAPKLGNYLIYYR